MQALQSRGSDPKLSTVNKWQRALEAAGVEFMDEGPEHGSGVRLQKGKPAKNGRAVFVGSAAMLCGAVWFFYIKD